MKVSRAGERPSRGPACCSLAATLAAALALLVGGQEQPAAGPAADPLAGLRIQVTGGAAPGYVPDKACGMCHADLYASYQEVAMARSFRRAQRTADEPGGEDLSQASFVHGPSRQRFEMASRDGKLVFRRLSVGADEAALPPFETEVAWVLGSGNHARTYLYQTPAGEMYQLPMAWYSQEKRWGMAPGYDRPDHEGVMRRVRRECMFCHNAYPDVPAGSDAYGAPPLYPAELPEGIGCQRCHGPGAEHMRRVFGGEPREQVREAVVNPGRLPPARRDDVCFGCHLQPSVALAGLRRFERADYSFRPGEALSDYLVQVDVDEAGRPRSERFEINHHPYRLRQSRCYTASEGKLSCLTCHDPHRKVPAAERAAHYRAACLTCHQVEDCGRPGVPAGAAGEAAAGHGEGGDCASCHMPQRRPQDVVHVVMTDHRIARRPGGPEATAPLAESDPELTGVELTDPATAPPGALAEVYRTLAVVRAVRTTEAVDHLARKIAEAKPASLVPYYDLVEALLGRGRYTEAEAVLAGILARSPAESRAHEWLGIALAGQGKAAEGRAAIERALAEGGPGPPAFRPEARYNLGRLLLSEKRPAEALAALQAALDQRPNLAHAWFHLAGAQAALDRPAEAIAAYRRCLSIEPSHTRAYLALAELHLAAGDRDQALAVLRHGAVTATDRAAVTSALERLEANSP